MRMILHLWHILILYLLHSLLCHRQTFLIDQQPLSIVLIKRSKLSYLLAGDEGEVMHLLLHLLHSFRLL